jgi:hypothetical protein
MYALCTGPFVFRPGPIKRRPAWERRSETAVRTFYARVRRRRFPSLLPLESGGRFIGRSRRIVLVDFHDRVRVHLHTHYVVPVRFRKRGETRREPHCLRIPTESFSGEIRCTRSRMSFRRTRCTRGARSNTNGFLFFFLRFSSSFSFSRNVQHRVVM